MAEGERGYKTPARRGDGMASEAEWRDMAKKTHCKLLLLKRSLRNSALRFLLSLSLVETNDYQILRQVLIERYMPAEAQYVRRAQLRTRGRQNGESLSTLADDIRLLTARAYPRAGEMERDDYAMESFIQVLGKSLRMRVRDSQPRTMHGALRQALYLEAHSFAGASAKHEQSDEYRVAVSSVRDDRRGSIKSSAVKDEPDTLTRLCLAVEKLETRISNSTTTNGRSSSSDYPDHQGQSKLNIRKSTYEGTYDNPPSGRPYDSNPPPSFVRGPRSSFNRDPPPRNFDQGSYYGPPHHPEQDHYHGHPQESYQGMYAGPPHHGYEQGACYPPRPQEQGAFYPPSRPQDQGAFYPPSRKTPQGAYHPLSRGYGPPRNNSHQRPRNGRDDRNGLPPHGPSSHNVRFCDQPLN